MRKLRVRDVIRVTCAVTGFDERIVSGALEDSEYPNVRERIVSHYIAVFLAHLHGCEPHAIGNAFGQFIRDGATGERKRWSDLRYIGKSRAIILERIENDAWTADTADTVNRALVRLKAFWRRQAAMDAWRKTQQTTPRVYGKYKRTGAPECEAHPYVPPERDWAREQPLQQAAE